MTNKFKDTDIKDYTYYFFDDMIDVKNTDPNKMKIQKYIQKYSYLLRRICGSQRLGLFFIMKTNISHKFSKMNVCLYKLKMMYFDGDDVSEDIDANNKT